MNHINHIFFDLDHTLWDFEKNSALTFQQIFNEEQINCPLSSFLEVYVPTNLVYWKRYRNNEISKEELRYFRLKEVFTKVGFNASDALIHRVANRYIDILGTQKYLFDGCLEVLDYLSKKYELHIITNGFEEVQNNKLVNSGIAIYFKSVTTSEDVNAKKPDPRIFECALQKAKATKRESLMIGDSLEADIEGANAFGLQSIYFGNDVNYPGLKVDKLVLLKEIL